jgi:hypothetical protein
MKYSNSFYIKVIFLFLIFFFVSIYSVNKFRNIKHYADDRDKPSITIVQTFSEILKLSINRWVGIDALLSVSQSKMTNFDFFFLAWKEKVDNKKLPFYSENFNSKYHGHNDSAKNSSISIVTPGIVAFLYYSGSIIFVFFSISSFSSVFFILKIFIICSIDSNCCCTKTEFESCILFKKKQGTFSSRIEPGKDTFPLYSFDSVSAFSKSNCSNPENFLQKMYFSNVVTLLVLGLTIYTFSNNEENKYNISINGL